MESLARTLTESGTRIAASTLTLGELLVHPIRRGRPDLAGTYARRLTDSTVDLVPFDADAARFYAEVRARASIRPPDAVQVACALRAAATTFYTNDKQLWGTAAFGTTLDIRGL